MDTLTLKIPGAIKEKLNTYSKRKGLSKSQIVRNALLEYFEASDLAKQGTFYDLAQDPVPTYLLAVRKKPKSGKPEELLAYENIDVQAIVKKVLSILK